MKLMPIIIITVVVVAIAAGLFIYLRQPTASSEVRDVGKDIQRGIRDGTNKVKDTAEDLKDKAVDAVD